MKKLLLTAFEPFGGQTINASLEAAKSVLLTQFDNVQLEFLKLPVERFRSLESILTTIGRFQPDIIIMLGEASGRVAITPERVAINIDDFRIPDNAGNQPREETIVANGPAAYFSTLPILALTQALESAEVPSAISNTAGTYVCNHLFYGVMHYLAETASQTKAGFIHVPVLPEAKPQGAEVWPSMAREMIEKGLKVIIETSTASIDFGPVLK